MTDKLGKSIYELLENITEGKGLLKCNELLRNDGLISRWILPFIKGSGELIEKRRLVI